MTGTPMATGRTGRGSIARRTVDVETGYVPRRWQSKIARALKRFSVIVAHRRSGKSVFVINKLIHEALKCNKQMPRFGYIAPFLKQARQIAWEYIKHYTRPIPGMRYHEQSMRCTFPNGAVIELYGADNPDALRGLYFDGVVMDEVADMRPNVWGEVVRPALADRKGFAIFIGTPRGINLFSELYYRALEDPDWYADLFTVNDTDDALPADEVERAKREMTDDQFKQELLCDFHAATENCLMSVHDVEAAFERKFHVTAYDFAPKIMGVDVAWYGNDRSVIAKVQGVQSHGHRVFPGIDPMELAANVAVEADQWKPDMIFVDVGYAPGVCSRVQQLGYNAIGVHFGEKAGEERFENKRAEMWWALADWVKECSLPKDHALLNDLCAPTYTMKNRRGKIQLESKDDMRARGMPSPDLADAYALTFAHPVVPAAMREATDHCETAFDPYEMEN